MHEERYIERDDSVRIFFSTGKVSLVKKKKINKSYILYSVHRPSVTCEKFRKFIEIL